MRRIMLVLLMILCLAIILCTASADGITLKQSKEMVLAEAETAYPGWTVSAASSYGTGRYHDSPAVYVEVLLFRAEESTLRMKWLTALANPLWEGKDVEWLEVESVPVPLSDSAAARFAAMEPERLTDYNFCWLSEEAMSGCADFMLRDGESWVSLGVFEDTLIGAVRDSEGRKGLRIAVWDGTAFSEVIASPMWGKSWSLNEYHSRGDFLELLVDDGEFGVSRCNDGVWRLSHVNNGMGIYSFTDSYMLDGTNGVGFCSNNYWHYGRMTLPLELDVLDLDSIPWRGKELAAMLDADGWACVRESNTPIYSAPGGDVIAYGHARLAGTIAAEEDNWVCLQIGSETRGMQVWFTRNALAYGAETEDIRCGFPDYWCGEWKSDLTTVLNDHLVGLDAPFQDSPSEEPYAETAWLIAKMTDGSYLVEVNEDLVQTIPAKAFTKILPPEEYYPSLDFELDDEEWEALWSDSNEQDYVPGEE